MNGTIIGLSYVFFSRKVAKGARDDNMTENELAAIVVDTSRLVNGLAE